MKKIILVFLFFTFSLFNFAQESIIISNDSLVTDEVSFEIIENVPIYKGCDENMTNREKKQCMSSKISDLVAKNFNSSMAYTLGLEDGKYKINVIFKINEEGNIIDIKARALHPYFKKEAIRVIKLIPKMKPGMIRGKPVTVPYSLPIMFVVDNSKKDEKSNIKEITETPESFPVYKNCNENLSYENQKNCTTKKIMNFVKMSFNMDLADKLFPQDKSTQFKVDFVINKKGKVENITAKAHKREIAVEAIRVLKRLPKLKKPGYLN
jgi:Gram-negative bacterial TonB protein C-terminal